LEGKEDLIKGIEQDPKSKSKLKSNWLKILDFLKKKPKFESKVLFEIDEFLVQDSHISINLLVDIYNHYNKDKDGNLTLIQNNYTSKNVNSDRS